MPRLKSPTYDAPQAARLAGVSEAVLRNNYRAGRLNPLRHGILCRASAPGDPGAMAGYGYALLLGRGGPADPAEALLWLHAAADQGELGARYGLAAIYGAGEAVEANPVHALAHFLVADRFYGAQEGAEDRLRAALTDAEVLVAEALAAVWAPVVH